MDDNWISKLYAPRYTLSNLCNDSENINEITNSNFKLNLESKDCELKSNNNGVLYNNHSIFDDIADQKSIDIDKINNVYEKIWVKFSQIDLKEKFVKNNKPECNIDTKNDRLQDVIAKQKNEIHTLKAELTVIREYQSKDKDIIAEQRRIIDNLNQSGRSVGNLHERNCIMINELKEAYDKECVSRTRAETSYLALKEDFDELKDRLRASERLANQARADHAALEVIAEQRLRQTVTLHEEEMDVAGNKSNQIMLKLIKKIDKSNRKLELQAESSEQLQQAYDALTAHFTTQ